MQLRNSYYYFKSIIPPETCQRIIDYGVAKIDKEKSEGYDTNAYTFGNKEKKAMPNAKPQGEETAESLREKGLDPEKDVYVRDSEITWMSDQWLYDLIHPWIHQANRDAGWDFEWDYSEALQFTVYHGKEDGHGGFYSWHKDGDSDQFGMYRRYIHGVTPAPMKDNGMLPDKYVTDQAMVGKVRKISCTINLNAPGDYEGGNLKFDFGPHSVGDRYHECEEIRPQGSMIVFPSFIDHCVTPVTKGTRYSLVVWNLGKPFK